MNSKARATHQDVISVCSRNNKQTVLCTRMQCHCVTEEMSRRFSVRRMHETGAGRIGVEMMTGASVGTGMTIAKNLKREVNQHRQSWSRKAERGSVRQVLLATIMSLQSVCIHLLKGAK